MNSIHANGVKDKSLPFWQQSVEHLANLWPKKKSGRAAAYMALAGVLLRRDVPISEVESVLAALAAATGETNPGQHLRAVKATAQKLDAGEAATGMPRLCKLLGPECEAVINGLLGSLGLPQLDTEAHFTDSGNAQRLVHLHGRDLRYCHLWKQWLVWDGQRWKRDDTGAIVRCANKTIAAMAQQGARQFEEISQAVGKNEGGTEQPETVALKKKLEAAKRLMAHAIRSENANRIEAMMKLARSIVPIPVLHDQLNQNVWLLNCPNGTLDLKTGLLREHRREDLLTSLCPTPYRPDADCPTWKRFMEAVFEGDRELIAFMQQTLGLCLTGDVTEQALFILHGNGANGKSTLTNAIQGVIGNDYVMKAPTNFLLAGRGESHPTERADLFGCRLAICSETPQGRRLDESLVKEWTGGEPVRARRMNENFWEFAPTHKIFISTNYKPAIKGDDNGIWRRVRLIPFEVAFWNPDEPARPGESRPEHLKQDKRLGDKLRAEFSGILAWCVQGCLDWQHDGFRIPEKVRAATKEYRESEDVFASFMAECCTVGEGTVRANDLYARFKKWCEGRGENAPGYRSFGQSMTQQGFGRKKSNGVVYHGICLREENNRSPEP